MSVEVEAATIELRTVAETPVAARVRLQLMVKYMRVMYSVRIEVDMSFREVWTKRNRT